MLLLTQVFSHLYVHVRNLFLMEFLKIYLHYVKMLKWE